jgi:molybdopterin-containing oxidoreductase family membrane subunit
VGEYAEYVPSSIELMIISGVWAIGFFILTVLIKGAVGILLGDVRYQENTDRQVQGKQAGAVAT